MLKNLIFTIFISLIMTNNSQAKFMNKFKEGFYFEKYKTADKAKNVYIHKKFGTAVTRDLKKEDYPKIDELRLKEQYENDAMTDHLNLPMKGLLFL